MKGVPVKLSKKDGMGLYEKLFLRYDGLCSGGEPNVS
jgi:hypothetical protein